MFEKLENKKVIEQIKQGEGFHTLSEQELEKFKNLNIIWNKSLQKSSIILLVFSIILFAIGISLLNNLGSQLDVAIIVLSIAIGTEFLVFAFLDLRYNSKKWDERLKRQIKREKKILERVDNV